MGSWDQWVEHLPGGRAHRPGIPSAKGPVCASATLLLEPGAGSEGSDVKGHLDYSPCLKERKRLWYCWVWWCTSVIPAAEMLRQEDYSEFEVTPVLKEQEQLLSSCPHRLPPCVGTCGP